MRLLPHYQIKTTDLDVIRPVVVRIFVEAFQDSLLALFLFGSYATGKNLPESDLDFLAVLGTCETPTRQRMGRLCIPESYQGPDISPVIFTESEFLAFPPILLGLLEGCQIWYSKDRMKQGSGQGVAEAENLLESLRAYAASRSLKRIPHKGRFYWKLQ